MSVTLPFFSWKDYLMLMLFFATVVMVINLYFAFTEDNTAATFNAIIAGFLFAMICIQIGTKIIMRNEKN